MNLDLLEHPNITPAKKDEILAQSLQLIKQGAAETRTLSYLLHPPLLDEAGLASAVRWYVDGFAERSKIDVSLEVDPLLGRLPSEVELVLFRALQECLGNIHRHSGSPRAEIRIRRNSEVLLTVEDYGKGISQKLLDEFRTTHTGTGVGLAGMRERVSDVGECWISFRKEPEPGYKSRFLCQESKSPVCVLAPRFPRLLTPQRTAPSAPLRKDVDGLMFGPA